MPRKVTTSVYITEEQQVLLKTLNRKTKVPVAEFIREGIDLVIEKHREQLPGQMKLSALPPGQDVDQESGSENLSIINT